MMRTKVLITGVGGLVGSAVAEYFHRRGWGVVGVDNNLRGMLLTDPAASTQWNIDRLSTELYNFVNYPIDIRNTDSLEAVFAIRDEIGAIVHCAAQASHEGDLQDDFTTNVVGTLNLLGLWKKHCPGIPFVYMSTIKVYGDYPNQLRYATKDMRLDLSTSERHYEGFDEQIPIGGGTSSFFGRSKMAADMYVQEYSLQYGMRSVCFRASCITGGYHSGVEAHGMLSYLMKCVVTETPYKIYGFGGKQVRDQLHAEDMAAAIYTYVSNPKRRIVYNIGGGRSNACSILEAIKICESITGNKLEFSTHSARHGDHCWWITDSSLFEADYPSWYVTFPLVEILQDIYEEGKIRW